MPSPMSMPVRDKPMQDHGEITSKSGDTHTVKPVNVGEQAGFFPVSPQHEAFSSRSSQLTAERRYIVYIPALSCLGSR